MTVGMKSYLGENGLDIWQFPEDGSEDAFIPAGLKLLDERGLVEARKAQDAANAPTEEQLKEAAYKQRDSLLAVAALRIAPLQYAVDLDTATDSDRSCLTAWKQYSVDANRIDQQERFPLEIEWPVQPA